jgi:hypothetical protein
MKPVRSVKNQYRGINAHLHSLLQHQGGWSDFHARHIVHIADTLKSQLRSMRYTAGVEESVQIKRLSGRLYEPESDVLIYDTEPPRLATTTETAAALEGSTTIAELIAEEQISEKPFHAVIIYDVRAGQSGRGKPVAWIELLSPSNKGNSEDAQIYRLKRLEILAAGLVFVELDYLHETPPTFASIPAYRWPGKNANNHEAHPYRIVVLDPRGQLEKGPAWVKSLDVDQPLPQVMIPLSGDDAIQFDFGIPYTKTFEEGFLGDQVDYTELPIAFEHYTHADRTRIARRMAAVLAVNQANRSLENGPFPVEETDLDTALAQIQAIKQA